MSDGNEKMSQENTTKKSKYDRGFIIRMSLLSAIMLVLGAVYLVDRYVVVPAADTAIEKMNEEFPADVDHKQRIRELAGKEPFKTNKIHIHELESYRFNRVLPFLAPRLVDVVYVNGKIVEVLPGGYAESDLDQFEEPVKNLGEPGGPPGMSNAGAVGGNNASRQPDDSPDQDKDVEQKDDGNQESDPPDNGASRENDQ